MSQAKNLECPRVFSESAKSQDLFSPPVSGKGLFLSLIRTSRSFGYLLEYVPDADWIPIDSPAATILDIAHFAAESEDTTRTYISVNPHSTPWAVHLDTVLQHFNPQKQIQVTESCDWIQMLQGVDMNDTQELTAKLAAKVLDFYRVFEEQKQTTRGGGRAAKYSTANAITVSKTMAQLEPVYDGWVEIWLTKWGY